MTGPAPLDSALAPVARLEGVAQRYKQVVALAGVTLGLVGLPPRPVEAVIALSIVFLAVELVRGRDPPQLVRSVDRCAERDRRAVR